MRRLTLKVIERRIRNLREQAEKLKQQSKAPALREVVNLMREHDLSVGEVRAALLGAPKPRKTSKSKLTRKRRTRKVRPMYRNPKTGETWSGRGRTARWLAAAEKAGHKRSEFLINRN